MKNVKSTKNQQEENLNLEAFEARKIVAQNQFKEAMYYIMQNIRKGLWSTELSDVLPEVVEKLADMGYDVETINDAFYNYTRTFVCWKNAEKYRKGIVKYVGKARTQKKKNTEEFKLLELTDKTQLEAFEARELTAQAQLERALQCIKYAREDGKVSTDLDFYGFYDMDLLPEVAKRLAEDGYDVEVIIKDYHRYSEKLVCWENAKKGRKGVVKYVDKTQNKLKKLCINLKKRLGGL